MSGGEHGRCHYPGGRLSHWLANPLITRLCRLNIIITKTSWSLLQLKLYSTRRACLRVGVWKGASNCCMSKTSEILMPNVYIYVSTSLNHIHRHACMLLISMTHVLVIDSLQYLHLVNPYGQILDTTIILRELNWWKHCHHSRLETAWQSMFSNNWIITHSREHLLSAIKHQTWRQLQWLCYLTTQLPMMS